jgi:hypothetical protein
MITASLGILSTALLFWSATVAGEWRSAVIGIAGFAVLVAAMLTAHAAQNAETEPPHAIPLPAEAVRGSAAPLPLALYLPLTSSGGQTTAGHLN